MLKSEQLQGIREKIIWRYDLDGDTVLVSDRFAG